MNKKIKIIVILLILLLPCPALANVVINEIMIGQTGATKNEFIELYNPTENDIDLANWTLKKKVKSGKESNLVSPTKFTGIINAHGYFLIAHSDYKDTINADLSYSGSSYSISNNSTIILYDSEDNVIDKVGYGEAADFENQASIEPANNQSIERQGYIDSDNNYADFVIRDTPSPQNSGQQLLPEQQSLTEPVFAQASNYPPYAEAGPDITALTSQEIVFDASLSWDPDWDSLEYFWNFGDGSTDTKAISSHTYTIPGQYIATLKVNDKQFADIDSVFVNIYDNSVIISEFLPNPEGKDEENEWIELYNQNSQIANLSGWQISDSQKSFIFPENSLIAPRQFLVLKRPATKLSLNNDGDEVKLIFPNGEIASQVSYAKGEGAVAFQKDGYFWTAIPTPGAPNIVSSQETKSEKTSSSNIPSPIIEESQNPPDTLSINLAGSENFSASNFSEKNYNQTDIQSQNLLAKIKPLPDNNSNPAPQNSKANLILILSIIISFSILSFWGVSMAKKKQFFH